MAYRKKKYPRKGSRYGGGSMRRAFKKYRKTSRKGLRGYKQTGGLYTGRFRKVSGRRTEMKFVDTNIHSAAAPAVLGFNGGTTGTSLNLLSQGASANQRIGRKIVAKSVRCHVAITREAKSDVAVALNVQEGIPVRVCLVLDRQTNGIAAQWQDVFDTNADAIPPHLVHQKISTNQRFRILYDKTMVINPADFVAYDSTGIKLSCGGVYKTVKLGAKLNLPIEFDGLDATASINNVRSNGLLLFVMAGSDPTGGKYGQWPDKYTASCRLRFTDV